MSSQPTANAWEGRRLRPPALQGALLVFLVAIAALATRYQLPLMDDVYITLRHSLNLARGNGLVYNAGEPVLAATSPLYALFLSSFYPLTKDLVLVAIYSWPVFVGAAAFIAYRLIGGGPAGMLGALLLCAEPNLRDVVGMDTAFYVFCMLLTLWLFQKGRLKPAAFLLGVMPMVRPDGVFLIAAVALVWATEHWKSIDRTFLRRNAALFLLFAIPLAAWCAIAIAYYGTPVPNSFIGKFYQGRIRWWWSDSDTFRHQFLANLHQWRPRALLAGSVLAVPLAVRQPDRVLRTGLIWAVLYFGAYSISHVPAYGNYFFPIAAVMTVLALRASAILAQAVLSRLSEGKWTAGRRFAATALLATAGFALVWRRSDRMLFSAMPPALPSAYLRIANFLRSNTPAGASVGVMEIGIIGYFSERRIVDFAGLASPGVAKAVAGGDLRFALERFHPDYVIARYPGPGKLEGGLTERELAARYRWLFGLDGVGVFEPVRVELRSTGDLNEYDDTVFILREPIDERDIAVLNSRLTARGSLLAPSYPLIEHDIRGKRFAYVSFKEGRADGIKPMLEPSQVPMFTKPVVLDFDTPEDKLGAWNQVSVADPKDSLIHLSATGSDPYVTVPAAPFAPWFLKALKIRLRASARGSCDHAEGGLLWITNLDPAWGAHDKAIRFPVATDGQWHDIEVDLSRNPAWNGSGIVTALRYDPISCRAEMDLDSFRVE